MRKQKIDSFSKKIAGGFLAMVMLVSGILFLSEMANATETITDEGYVYSDEYDFKTYWGNKKAPVMEDCVFAGWYADKTGTDYITEAEAEAILSSTDTTTKVYAKFVPASVLSVKAQNAENTTATSPSTSVRLITSVDSKNYQKVGFEIYLGNGTKLLKQQDGSELETSRVYKGIQIGTSTTKTAEQIFGKASKHVAVWELTNIVQANYSKIICVRPYWETMDGTIVKGLAKYVHIEDDYKNYISVPVNMMTGELVAAGMMNLKYDQNLTFVEVEAGRLLPEMLCNHDATTKTIRMVGNAGTVNTNVSADGIYANVRFEKPSTTTNFDITVEKFCNWEEADVTITKAWDITYEVAPTTEE